MWGDRALCMRSARYLYHTLSSRSLQLSLAWVTALRRSAQATMPGMQTQT
jgi:hypothetical protein